MYMGRLSFGCFDKGMQQKKTYPFMAGTSGFFCSTLSLLNLIFLISGIGIFPSLVIVFAHTYYKYPAIDAHPNVIGTQPWKPSEFDSGILVLCCKK